MQEHNKLKFGELCQGIVSSIDYSRFSDIMSERGKGDIIFNEYSFDFKYDNSANEEEKEEGKSVLPITYTKNRYELKQKKASQLAEGLPASVASSGALFISGAKINKIRCRLILCLKR